MIDVEKLKKGGSIVSIRDQLIDMQSKGQVISRTESGDPSFNIPENVQEAIIKATKEGKTHYTLGAGIKELREAIVEKVRNKNKIIVKGPNNVVVTSGAMNGLYTVFQAVVNGDCDAEVLVSNISWTETIDNVILAKGKPVYYSIDPFDLNPINIEEIKNLINPKTKAIVINTPHNPTGVVLRKELLTDIFNLCVTNNIYLIMDEAYEDIVFNPSAHWSIGQWYYDKIITIFSCSKSYAMSGLRVGYVICNDEEVLKRTLYQVRCTINGVNSISQWGATSAILNTPWQYFADTLIKYYERRDALYSSLVDCSFLKPLLPQGAFYIWCKINEDWKGYQGDTTSWGATALLLEHGIGSAPGEVFGPNGGGCIRLSFSCDDKFINIAEQKLKTL